MQRKSEGSISYERETPTFAANAAAERQIPKKGVGTKNIEVRGVEGTKDAIVGLAGQGVEENSVNLDVVESLVDQAAAKKKKEYSPAEHARDANSQTIFSNRELTCQFLRDYTGISLFSDLRPEDIEDVTDHYKAFLGVEFEADIVKKVRVRVPEDEGKADEREVFVIPLIEHKTRVDYDVAMQLLRYMAVIWYDYKKQQESLKEGSSERKSFRYPPIIPIVYYEGKAPWTADMRLADRIDLSSADELAGYIPDFTYKMVRVHEYGNEELKKKHNEMSLVMMINRIQGPEDYTEFLKSSREYVDEIYNGTSEDIRKVYQEVLWSLLQKMNVPVKEARKKLAEMEEKGVGTLFADMEKMDIQEERRKTKLAREEADAAKKALEEFKLQTDKKLEQSNQALEQSNQKLEQSTRELEELKRQASQKLAESSAKMNAFFSKLVSLCRGEKMSREEAVMCLRERYGLEAEDAVSAVEQFWNC